ncbi:MAG: hypothetical protein RBR09_13540 [Desulfobulbaceae bacterium]|jgi:hypothetical protein|nr:hypothetical protein [Deltaproteobacteria bacterium]MDY0352272.1 hypothetical protein [Desulfobulbaceae bacterium]
MDGHWHRLEILLRNCPEVAGSVLRAPCPELPPGKGDLDRLVSMAASAGLKFLLRKHVLSCLALPGWRENEAACDNLARLLNEYGNSTPVDLLHSMAWTCLPVPVCQGNRVTIVWFLLGCQAEQSGPAVSIFLPPVPAPEAVEAMESAAKAVYNLDPEFRRVFRCCSLQDVLDEPVHGRSLGLAFGLAMALLSENASWVANCHATGELSPRGEILPVGRVQEKWAAVRYRARIFLHPEEGISAKTEENQVACRTLTDALFILRLAAGGMSPDKAALYKVCAHDGLLLLRNLQDLPASFFELPQVREQLQEMAGNPAVFLGPMADALTAAAAHNYPGGPSLADLLTPTDIERLAAGHPDLDFCAFKWCIGSISLANHRGDIQGAEPWRTPAERLLERVHDDDKLEYLNHRFVGERFNRYDFRPEIPADIAALLEIEERRQAVSPRENRNLGAIYGTIAQNFGFCGPVYLAELRRYARLAIAAFGSRHRVETLRPRAYLIYGLLDGGLLDEAAVRLNDYLGIPENSRPEDVLAKLAELVGNNPADHAYQAAVTSRALADIGREGITLGSRGLLSLVAGKTFQGMEHPWQLTALNLGRLYLLTGEEKNTERLLRHAVDICHYGETTMQVMSLLPLAELHWMGVANSSDYILAGEIGKLLRGSPDLNRAHFQVLFREPAQPDPRAMLAAVYALRHTLFPFSYR